MLLVRPDGTRWARDAHAPFRHVAVCVEDSAQSRRALYEARVLRGLGAARLSVVHVAQWPMAYLTGGFGMVIDPTDVFEREQEWLAETVREADGEEPVFLTGYPPVAVCEWAAKEHPDVIVAAAHRALGERILLGSFAHYVAYHSPCSVLLTRTPCSAGAADGGRG